MKPADMTHLASLARIKLTDAEITSFSADLSQIVEYVSVVSDIAADASHADPTVGVRYNVLRADVVTNQPDQYTKAALAAMPQTAGRHLLVKRIMKAK